MSICIYWYLFSLCSTYTDNLPAAASRVLELLVCTNILSSQFTLPLIGLSSLHSVIKCSWEFLQISFHCNSSVFNLFPCPTALFGSVLTCFFEATYWNQSTMSSLLIQMATLSRNIFIGMFRIVLNPYLIIWSSDKLTYMTYHKRYTLFLYYSPITKCTG